MVATLAEIAPPNSPQIAFWRRMPPRMRVLLIATRPSTGVWLSETLAADSASNVTIEEALGQSAGLERLRDEVFDAVLVSHEPGVLDALDLIEGYRAGGSIEPIVVIGNQDEQTMAPLCYEVGADGYVATHSTTRGLLWVLARAVQRHRIVRENQRLTLAEENRLQHERDDAACMLEQQQELLNHLGRSEPPLVFPEELIEHYRQLLRSYIIMGSGTLPGELQQLSEVLLAAGLSAVQAMRLHLTVVSEMIHGLGARSTRHVMARADLLAMEILLRLGEGYRRK